MVSHPVRIHVVWILLSEVISNLKAFFTGASRDGFLHRSWDICESRVDQGDDLVFIHFYPNVKGHRTPDQVRDFDRGLSVDWS